MSKKEKVALGVDDIMERYGIGKAKAYSVMRAIKSFRGSLEVLGENKVLISEVEWWEQMRGGAASHDGLQ